MASDGAKVKLKVGRPKNSISSVSKKARQEAAGLGLLPHEWLLMVARGEPVPHNRWKIKFNKNGDEVSRELVKEDYYPDFSVRVDAAKSCAAFYAPRLAVQTISGNITSGGSPDAVADVLKEIAAKLPV